MRRRIIKNDYQEKPLIRSLEASTESIATSLKVSTSRFIKNIAMRFQEKGVDREGVANLKDLSPLIREIRATDKELYESMHELLKKILFFVSRDAERQAITHIENRDLFMNMRDMYIILNDIRRNEKQDLEDMTEDELQEMIDNGEEAE